MEFNIERKKKRNSEHYHTNDVDLAYQFAKKVHKEFGNFIKAIVLFGSAAKRKKSHDIDILVVIDDLSLVLTREIVQAYRIMMTEIVAKISTKLHITTLRFTNFWEYTRAGDPVAVNMLRDGFALIDTGFFEPLQALLHQGRIRPTPEAVWTYFSRAPQTIINSKGHIIQATVDLYWGVIDAAHAALMRINEIPPSPDHVAEIMEEKLVKPGIIDKKLPKTMSRFYDIMKLITSRDMKEVSGVQYDEYLKEATEFITAMEKFIRKQG